MNLKLIEYICALFPQTDYTFPEGNYRITMSNKTYLLTCKRMILLKTNRFVEVSAKLRKFYNSLKSNGHYFDQRFPYPKERGLLLHKDYFTTALEDYCKKIDCKKGILSMIDDYYCLYLTVENNYNGPRENVIEYINKIRGGQEIRKSEQIYFSVVEEFYKYIIILRSPYINITDINYRHIDTMFTYFCWEDQTLITEEMFVPFCYWEPRIYHLSTKIQDFFNKKVDVPIEDLFMAKAKVYERLNNNSMAIIHTVIALEIVVPKFINRYLDSMGVDADSVKDFNNKFGLSVRVRAILKIILPAEYHENIWKVGTIIKHRNKIIHEGKTNDFFKGINVRELITASESLIIQLKKRTKQLEN